MEFGVQFFPAVGPNEVSAEAYWNDSLDLCELCDDLGYTNIRTVEHYFMPYGGYSPSPLAFLAAASQRSRKAKLITGAVLPVFANPLKLAGEIGMLDAMSRGRVEIGFARAFLPHEFTAFGVSLDESRARFDEGLEQVRRLLEEERVTSQGKFHSFKDVTSLPRPTQKPRPPFWIAAATTPQSFQNAGMLGHNLMATPSGGMKMRQLLDEYRNAWRAAGHPGTGKIMLAFHMFCDADRKKAYDIAREPLNAYMRALTEAASHWGAGTSSKDYPGYDKMIDALAKQNFDNTVAAKIAWVGTPADIRDMIRYWQNEVGEFHTASLQVTFHNISKRDGESSMRLFAKEVIPHFR